MALTMIMSVDNNAGKEVTFKIDLKFIVFIMRNITFKKKTRAREIVKGVKVFAL